MCRHKGIDYLLVLFLILSVFRNICIMFSLMSVATLLFYSAHVVLALIIILIVLIKFRYVNENCYSLAGVLVMIMALLIPMSYGVEIWLVSSFTPISFLFTILFLILSKDIIISEKTIRIVCLLHIIQAVFAVVFTFFPSSYEYGALVLHIGNPNQTAIVLWPSFVFCYLCWANNLENKNYTFVFFVLMIVLAIMIVLTQSRSIIIASLICILLHIWKMRKNGYDVLQLFVQSAIALAPIYIPILILILMNILPSEVTIFGKLLFSGREQIWNNILDAFIQNPLANHLDSSPYYSKILLNNAETIKGWGAHNGFLAIQWNYGLFVLIPFVYILYNNVVEMRTYAEINSYSCLVYIALIATLFSLSFEEAFLMGNVCTTTFIPLLFIVGRSEIYNTVQINM